MTIGKQLAAGAMGKRIAPIISTHAADYATLIRPTRQQILKDRLKYNYLQRKGERHDHANFCEFAR
jgi:hypothetical protein